MCSKRYLMNFILPFYVKGRKCQLKVIQSFFESSSAYLPPASPSICICLKIVMQPANWMCVKDSGSSIQAFAGFLEYRNVWKFHNETLFVNSKVRCVPFFLQYCICRSWWIGQHCVFRFSSLPYKLSPYTLRIPFLAKNTTYRPIWSHMDLSFGLWEGNTMNQTQCNYTASKH